MGTQQARKKGISLTSACANRCKWHFLNRKKFSHLIKRLRVSLGDYAYGQRRLRWSAPLWFPRTYPSGSLRAAISTRRLCCI